MPELPEVETIRRGLGEAIVGKTIADLEIREAKLFQGDKEKVIGQKIIEISRRAKQLIIKLENGYDLLIHLKMTGQLVFRSPFSVHRSPNNNEPDQVLTDNGQRTTDNDFAGGHPSKDWFEYLPNSTTHIIFHFSDRSVLFFNDMRKFGWIKVIKSDELEAKLSSELGPEPLDKSFTADELAKIIRSKPKWNIKKILTDQTLISGIGNIYADEALYWAGILPTRIGGEISDDEILKLRDAIIKSLEVGLKYGGSSENTYVRVDGSRGHAQEHSQVYGREGKPCNHCQGKVEKIRLNGRGTHFCTNCQK